MSRFKWLCFDKFIKKEPEKLNMYAAMFLAPNRLGDMKDQTPAFLFFQDGTKVQIDFFKVDNPKHLNEKAINLVNYAKDNDLI